MTLELGDASSVRCVTSDLVCELDFQTKGFFSGQPNSVVGKIKKESTQEILYEICGQWSGEIFIKKYTPPEKSGITGLLVNFTYYLAFFFFVFLCAFFFFFFLVAW